MNKLSNLLIAIILIVSVAIVLFMPTSNANSNGFVLLTKNSDLTDSYFENGKLKQEIIGNINSQINNVPEQLFELFGDNKINFYIKFDDGSTNGFFAITKKNKLEKLFRGTNNLADIEIRLTEQVVDEIILSKDPLNEFLNAMKSGKIKYKGLTFGGEVKSATVTVSTTIIDVISQIIGFFTGFFN